jgi:hypothetical protein
LRDPKQIMTVLARTRSNRPKRQTLLGTRRTVRQKNLVMGPAVPDAKNDCAGEASNYLPDESH